MALTVLADVMAGDVVVVYSVATGVVRYLCSSTINREIPSVDLKPGEAVLRVTKAAAQSLPQIQRQVRQITGKSETGRCVVVRDGLVVGAILADPACGDAVDGCLLIPHDTAGAGWAYDGRTFTAPPVSAEDLIVQARALARGR